MKVCNSAFIPQGDKVMTRIEEDIDLTLKSCNRGLDRIIQIHKSNDIIKNEIITIKNQK